MSEKWTDAPSHMLRARETRERIRAAFPIGDTDEEAASRKPVYSLGMDMLGGEIEIGVMADNSVRIVAWRGDDYEERGVEPKRAAELASAISGGATAKADLSSLMRAALDSGDWDRVQRVALAIRTHEEAEAIACSAAAQLAGLKAETI